jgi:hypothetical protein
MVKPEEVWVATEPDTPTGKFAGDGARGGVFTTIWAEPGQVLRAIKTVMARTWKNHRG